MSASLVGSEMCIRDSIITKRGPRVAQELKVGIQQAWRFAGCARLAANPVSYTHLTLPTICSV
eukprot:13113153-Alexandrium_andersonii.AAC.1